MSFLLAILILTIIGSSVISTDKGAIVRLFQDSGFGRALLFSFCR